jgi:aspartyl protease family protein
MLNRRNCRRLLALLSLLPAAAGATDVSVVGLFRDKAVLIVDGSPPHTLSIGQISPEGVRLLEADSRTATVEVAGQKQTITLGASAAIVAAPTPAGPRKVTLYPDSQGHFVTLGSVNGQSVRFVVDSGASLVVLPASEARHLGIDYSGGKPGTTMTANGMVGVTRLTLPSVKIGELELKNVDAEITEGAMPSALLGMSFLGRLSMFRDGRQLTLTETDQAKHGASTADVDKSGHARVTMAQQQGHFFSNGSINGIAINFMVDTGATLVSISVADARRMGINYLQGTPAYSLTANGKVPVYRMKFDEVKVGDIVLHNIDGAVIDGGGLPIALLGMSFLTRTDIRRDGNTMTLTQRF